MTSHEVINVIDRAIGYRFVEVSRAEEALTHASYAAEHAGATSYERLEFLGDAVVELVTTQMIYEALPDEPEGSMTKVRASVVDESTLASIAREWGVSEIIRLGIGEERSGGRYRDSILSDVCESLIAAVFLDGGFAAAERVVRSTWGSVLAERIAQPDVSDARSRLQELLAVTGRVVEFRYDRSGPDHAAVYTAAAVVDDRTVGEGTGGSKKAAAIAAATNALDRGV
jgi:ribonuclease III